jgi:hypothetical protein
MRIIVLGRQVVKGELARALWARVKGIGGGVT